MREIFFFCPTTEIRVSKLLLNGIQIPNPYRGGRRALGWLVRVGRGRAPDFSKNSLFYYSKSIDVS